MDLLGWTCPAVSLPMITLAFYKGTRQENPKARLFDRLICWWHLSRGRFSHVELVIPGTRMGGRATCASASSRDGGVRSKRITLTTGRWVLVTLPFHPSMPAVDWFDEHEDARYDWRGVAGFVLTWLRDSWSRFYCSRALALAIRSAALAHPDPAVSLEWPVAARISPSALFQWAVEQPGAEVFELPQTTES